MEHQIKIQQCFLIHILEGRKRFEIRKNDRDYQVGDLLQFLPLGDSNYNAYSVGSVSRYKIQYVHTGFGMNQNHVVLGIEPENPTDE